MVRQHHDLLIDPKHLTQRLEDGHHDHGLAGAGGDEEVEQSDKGVNDEQGDHRALALQQAGHGVDDGVGDVALGKQDGHRPAQADYHGGRHHAGHALAELGAGLGNAHAPQ